MLLPRDPWLAVPVAWLGFVALGFAVKAAMRRLPEGPRWRPHAALKIALLVLSFALAGLEGLSPRDLGLRPAAQSIWGASIGLGLGLGAVSTLVILLAGLQGLRKVMVGHSLPSIVFWFWIVSSVAEEVFCRGWFQASVMDGAAPGALGALLPSAVLFGSLHLVMLFAGVDRASVAFVVVSTTALGLLAAWAKAATGSLYPPIAAHVAFNVGGMMGGVAYAGMYRAFTGRMPFQRT